MKKHGRPWSILVAVDDIPDAGLHRVIDAPAEARMRLAGLAGLRDLALLRAEFDLTRRGAGVHVSGRVQAQVGQTCVVSLEPVENAVDETVDVLFTPGTAAGGDELGAEPGIDGRDPPEPLVDGIIDLGALATEFLLLGVDPYPRKAGVEFAAPEVEDAGERPFAALEALKKRLGPA
jgi:uncharacterized metal-binding protein YceD (DUF177 family)